MKKLIIVIVALAVGSSAQNKPTQTVPSPSANTVTFPTSSAPTIPNDAMFALGQQSVQLQSIAGRLDKMEPDISSLKHDVDKILVVYDMVLFSVGAIFTIVASYVVVRLIKKFWPEPSPPAPPTLAMKG